MSREFSGISFDKSTQRWLARTNIPGHAREFIGRFDTFEEALTAQTLAGMAIVSKQFADYAEKMRNLQNAE